MLCVLAYCEKDALAAINLLNWIQELDGSILPHRLLLMAATSVSPHTISRVIAAAKSAFSDVVAVKPTFGDESGWPGACNHLFRMSALHIQKTMPQYFWWLEPDCVPIKPGWLSSLEEEYRKLNSPFMGCIYERPFRHLTGCAMYPFDIHRYNPYILIPEYGGIANNIAWDCICPWITLPFSKTTPLFQHEWGDFENNIPPKFPDESSLSIIRPETVLFHRSKSGDMIEQLRKQRRPKVIAQLHEGLRVFRDNLRVQGGFSHREMA